MMTTWNEMSELEQFECTYCGMYKDVYGVKARWYKGESVDKVRADLEVLGRALEAANAREALSQQAAIKAFQQVADQYCDGSCKAMAA